MISDYREVKLRDDVHTGLSLAKLVRVKLQKNVKLENYWRINR